MISRIKGAEQWPVEVAGQVYKWGVGVHTSGRSVGAGWGCVIVGRRLIEVGSKLVILRHVPGIIAAVASVVYNLARASVLAFLPAHNHLLL